MRYDNPDLQDALAAEYVLGTLRGAARRRMERLILARPALREQVHAWEQRLSPLTGALAPRTPPERVWRGIRRRITPAAATRRRRWLAPWPTATVAASVAAAALALYVALAPITAEPEYLAVIQNDQGRTVWSLTADVDTDRLQARAVGEPAAVDEGRVPELWLMPPAAGEQPRSLGLLPRDGSSRNAVPPGLLAGVGDEAAIAVSLEPPGGSPTGLPTGPVVYQGRLVRL